jgi:hypothetical protein
VEEGSGGAIRHTRVAIGGTAHHPLKQPKDAAHLGVIVQRRHKMHLACAGIREAHRYPSIDQGLHQTLRTVHVIFLPKVTRAV